VSLDGVLNLKREELAWKGRERERERERESADRKVDETAREKEK